MMETNLLSSKIKVEDQKVFEEPRRQRFIV
jgi:hypothetical protein